MPGRDTHYALVVGVTHYQDKDLGELKGAVEDAAKFLKWVTSPSGGDVGTVIHLTDPTIQQIEDAFRRICEPADTKRYVGERLYVYLSGHGVAQDVHEASLLAADGGENARDRHVPGWHWMSWFLNSCYFDEVVLFADCCRTLRGTWAVRPFPLDLVIPVKPPHVRWVRAFASQFGGIAIEHGNPDERRGVLTEALLDALKHARKPDPQDPTRWHVTGQSVRDHLFNSPELAKWRDYQAPQVLVESDLVLASGSGGDVELVVPVREGETPVIHGGPRAGPWPLRPGDGTGELRVNLPRGLYAASVPGRSAFFAIHGGEEEVHLPKMEEHPANAPAPTSRVVLRGTTPATEVYLINSVFELHQAGGREARALGRYEADVPPGVYKARFQLGNKFEDQLFQVGPRELAERSGGPQDADSAVPLRGTRWPADGTPPDLDALWAAASRPAGDGAGVLTVMLREGETIAPDELRLSLQGEADVRRLPWQAVSGWQVASLRLPAGTHVLKAAADGSWLCRAAPVLAGQQTAVAIRQVAEKKAADRRLGTLLRGGLVMAPFPIAGNEEDLLRQAVAQEVLGRSRALEEPPPPASLSSMMLLLRAHGVLEARRARQSHPLDPLELTTEDRGQVKAAYDALQGSELAGLADVAALGFALELNETTRPVNLDVPPLLASTWRTLVTASLSSGRPPIVGKEPALRMAEGMMTSSLWLTWEERATVERLDSAAQDLLAPGLRPGAGSRPAWTGARSIKGLAQDSTDALARSLQLPVALVQELVRTMTDERAIARHERIRRRTEALQEEGARVCLVVLPDGVRVDPNHGQPIDFDAVMDELVNDAAERAGLVAVRAPPVSVNSKEMREAMAQADVLLVDGTFGSQRAASVADVFRAARGEDAAPLVCIRAEGHQAGEGLGDAEVHQYQATYGVGLSFLEPAGFQRALAEAARRERPPGDRGKRSGWLEAQVRTECRRRELQDLAVEVNDLMVQDKKKAREVLGRALPSESLRGASASVQLDSFLVCRSAESWQDMERCYEEMDEALRNLPLVREQRALGLKWSGETNALKEATDSLEAVIAKIGPNGETCGLLGGLYKKMWWDGPDKEGAETHFDAAIAWYGKGLRHSQHDPYPGVNLLTLWAHQGTEEAMRERASHLELVKRAALARLRHRPNYWDLVTMMEVAANERDRKACLWYQHRAMAAPHERWQAESSATNLRILCHSKAREFQGVEKWLKPLADALAENRPAAQNS